MWKITLIKSPIGMPEHVKRTVRGLGLRKLQKSVYRVPRNSIAGMIYKIKEMVRVETVEPAKPVTMNSPQ
jgi:large subunit ribosomal protein L30